MDILQNNIQNRLKAIDYRLWILIGVVVSAAIFLLQSDRVIGFGFPLDDAWIHQTYAKNLFQTGKWTFSGGTISGGSTGPLWSIILVMGQVIGKPIVWSYIVGVLLLGLISLLGEKIYRKVTEKGKGTFPLVGLFIVTEWHFIWAALSGMETLLYSFGILLTFYLILFHPYKSFVTGIIIGIFVWARPEAVTLLGPCAFVYFFERDDDRWKNFFQKLFGLVSGLLIPLIPYLIFNYYVAGTLFPNTFYAKQMEYSILRGIPIYARVWSLLKLPLIGSGILLLPGFIYEVWQSIKHKKRYLISAFLWWAGIIGIYAVNLPVTYQHGRYLIPSMLVFYLISLIGMASIIKWLNTKKEKWKLLSFLWVCCVGGVQISFLILGAGTYAKDVAIIETEMVASAKWIASNTEDNALIAAHDIGALGYFGERRIVDLAGLINPDVIPIIRNEDALKSYLNEKDVNYILTFPSWYTSLVENKKSVYMTHGVFAPATGGENMQVYQWK